jgi:hypothetical protein
MTSQGIYRLTFARKFDRPDDPPLVQFFVPVGDNLIWHSDMEIAEIVPAIKLEYMAPKPVNEPSMSDIRALRTTLQTAAGSQAIWPALLSAFPDPDVRTALGLAYEIGYEDGESSAQDDRIFEEDDIDIIVLKEPDVPPTS